MLEKHAQEILLAVLCGVAVFLPLLGVYTSIYKRKVWKSHLFEVVLKKIRGWVYVTMVVVSAKVTVHVLPPTALSDFPADTTVGYVLLLLGTILTVEASTASIADTTRSSSA